jgi:hypothetical protein
MTLRAYEPRDFAEVLEIVRSYLKQADFTKMDDHIAYLWSQPNVKNLVFEENGHLVGFFSGIVASDDFAGTTSLVDIHWVMLRDGMEALHLLEQYARERGCDYLCVCYAHPRKAFERKGYTLHRVVYRKSLK